MKIIQVLFFSTSTRISKAVAMLVACSGLVQFSNTYAQASISDEPASKEKRVLEEVLITSQRRTERLQDVPISVSALGESDLTRFGIADVESLRGVVPSLNITSSAGANGNQLLAIRGVGGLASGIGSGQATSVYLDGVYLARPDAAFFALDDVERIEVLRGPQGTLYGRNSTAGTINIITKQPGNELEGGFDVSFGNFNSFNSKGSVSGPLTDNLSAGVSAAYSDRDGYWLNTVTGNDMGAQESYTLRGKLRYVSSDEKFSTLLSVDTSDIDGQAVIINQYAPPGPPPGGGALIGLGNPDEVSIAADNEAASFMKLTSDGVSLTMDYAINDNIDLTSITSYREMSLVNSYSLEALPPPLNTYADSDNETFTQELRAVISGDRSRATVGFNYYDDTRNWLLAFDSVPPAGTPLPVPANPVVVSRSEISTWALFGQFEYDFTDQLTGVLGVRYNDEELDYTHDTTQFFAPGPAILSGTISDDAVIPTFGLNYKLQEDTLLYAKVSKGYQAPGFNSGASGAAVATFIANGISLEFDAENLWAYEAGIKSRFYDQRATLNVSAFYYDYKDLQVRTQVDTQTINISNAAAAEVTGIEGEFSFQVTDNWSLSANATWLEAEYADYCQALAAGTLLAGDPTCDQSLIGGGTIPGGQRAGNQLILAPEFSGAVSTNFEIPVEDMGVFSANVLVAWESNSQFSAYHDDQTSTGGFERVDARLGFEANNGIEVYLYGKNLSDERYQSFSGRLGPGVPGTLTSINAPRTYGAGMRYRY